MIKLVGAELLAAQAFERFPLPAGLEEDALLLIAEMLAPQELALQFLPPGVHQSFRSLEEREFRAGCARSQGLGGKGLSLANAAVELFERVAYLGDLLVGRAQA
ncbi:MAG TPA: hypothetical protein VE866_15130 [Candidatus Binatia bacterium]|nr:hypothetical protein [Candidatus Binatia bacterium]